MKFYVSNKYRRKKNNELYKEYTVIVTNELNDVNDISTYLLSFIIYYNSLINRRIEMKL